jgi:predicted O-linked N-acetylglucosamine transferase (SPINDLY family)/thioredoxin-like negative regulator of GroEL
MSAVNRQQLLDEAMALQSDRHFPEAEKTYRKLIAANPRDVDAIQLLGYLKLQTAKPAEARPLYERALKLDPQPAFRLYLGECHLLEGNAAESLPLLEESVRQLPSVAEPHLYLGFTLLKLNRRGEALSAFRRAIAQAPDDDANVTTLANILAISNQHREAVEIFEDLRRDFPSSAVLRYALGAALVCLGRESEAEPHLKAAIDAGCAKAEAFDFLGRCDRKAGRINEALAHFQRAVRLKPGFLSAMNNLAALLADYDHLNQAIAIHCEALKIDPEYLPSTNNMASCLIRQGRISAAIDFSRRATKFAPDSPLLASNLLLNLNYSATLAPQALFDEHCHYQAVLDRHLKLQAKPVPPISMSPCRRRLGFVSGDLRTHSVAYWLEPLLANLDPARWEIVAFSTYGEPDRMTARLRGHIHEWHDLAGKNLADAYAAIHQAHVDVLVDLSGHTAHNLLPVFDRRAAPLQLSFLGYPNTTGLRNMDGRLTDAFADPPGATERYHSERLYRFARTAWCYQPPPNSPEPSRKPSEVIVFGCFNNLAKLQPPLFERWAEILRRIPNSRFYLKSGGLQDRFLRDSYYAHFAEVGIPAERVRIEGRKGGVENHLACYNQVDIALDSFPYHGTTTTAEALWMGVPVISLAGPDHRSRVGVSLLTNVGHPEWIAHDWDDYVARTVSLATQPNRLAALRATLRDEMRRSPLMDAAAYAADFSSLVESALHDRLVTISP